MNDTLNLHARATLRPEGFTQRLPGEVFDVHHEWKRRPADEAVYTVDELLERTGDAMRNSAEVDGVSWDDLRVQVDHRDCLTLVRPSREDLTLTHHSLTQLCGLPTEDGAVAPVDFVSRLSPHMAAGVINERLRAGVCRASDASLLVQRRDSRLMLRGLTTQRYERVWDHVLAQRIADLVDGGTWQRAEAFQRAGEASVVHARGERKRLPLGWVGDRSMFVCLVDYRGFVEHNGNAYARFLLLSNSEVGAGSLKVVFGLMDFACSNFILWGCTEVYEANFRHTKTVHERWDALSVGMQHSLSDRNRVEIVEGMTRASNTLIGKGKTEVLAMTRAATELPAALVLDAYERAEATPRYGDPRSVWGMLNGLTEASQHATAHADKRALIDAKAARIMGLMKR